MAFLDNSGDIILDAVLTDTGRYRLAKGDGSFRIVKFALGDDEIDYSLYDKNDARGSAYFDLSILQTPVLEAFTDNAVSLKSKLMSIPRTNLLYLPVVKLNDQIESSTRPHVSGAFMIAADLDTEKAISTVNGQTVNGIIRGETGGGSYIRLDQGLDTTEITPAVAIDSDLVETQYIIEIDNRLGRIASKVSNITAKVSYIDDDNIASYYFSLGTDVDYVFENTSRDTSNAQVIRGPRGTYIQFTVQSSLELNTSDYLFDQLGSTTTMDPSSTTVKFIDSSVRVIGVTTGFRVDVPIRFVKVP